MTELIILSGKQKGRKLRLPDEEVAIGTAEGCQIRLTSSGIGAKHCTLQPSKNGLFVHPTDNERPTLVNDTPIPERTLLRAGDTLRVGPMVFQVAAETDTKKAESPTSADSLSATDDDIASWLTDDDRGGTAASPPEGSATEEATPPTEPSVAEVIQKSQKKAFESVAEEGADIIRRYLEAQQKGDS